MSHHRSHQSGFTLVELMVAVAIGLLLIAGIGTLFIGVRQSNSIQERLATLHESGRYAVNRMEQDLRGAVNLYCSNYFGPEHKGASEPMWSPRPIAVFAPNIGFPDSGGMRSVDPITGDRSTALATTFYALSPRFFLQGYRCTTGTSCSPALPNTAMFPPAANAANSRVPNTDILTVRYIRGTGWPIATTSSETCSPGTQIQIAPRSGDDPVTPMTLAYISDCSNPSVVPISSVAGNTLTVGARLGPADIRPACKGGTQTTRVFDFTNDFVTVTYYLAYRLDDDPLARPNAGAQRLIPTLIRRENGVEAELVRGVDNLQFLFGVMDRQGQMRFLDANQVHTRAASSINCPLKAPGMAPDPTNIAAQEPGCLWRAVRRIEARMLVNGVSDVEGIERSALAYTFNGATFTPAPTTPLPSGLPHMRTPRREFLAAVAVKGHTP